MTFWRPRLWHGLAVSALVAAPGLAQTAPICLRAPPEPTRAGEAGEAGEGGEEQGGEAAELLLLTRLGQIAAALEAGHERWTVGAAAAAAEHYGIAADEGYARVTRALERGGQPPFGDALIALADAAARGDRQSVATLAADAERRVAAALAAAPGSDRPEAALAAGFRLLAAAAKAYGEGVICERIDDATAVEEARGLVEAAATRFIAPAAAALGARGGGAARAADETRAALLRLWSLLPASPADGQPATDPALVTAATSQVELAASGLR